MFLIYLMYVNLHFPYYELFSIAIGLLAIYTLSLQYNSDKKESSKFILNVIVNLFFAFIGLKTIVFLITNPL